jgi:predicted  nucleic acid-binding Zn-ribbon protein
MKDEIVEALEALSTQINEMNWRLIDLSERLEGVEQFTSSARQALAQLEQHPMLGKLMGGGQE